MAYPVIEATLQATAEGSYGAADYAPNITSLGAVAGDRILALVGGGVGAARTYTASGWTQRHTRFDGSALQMFLFEREATGTDPFTLVKGGASSALAAMFWRISGHDSATATEAISAQTGVSADSPSLSPSWGSAETLWFSGTLHDGKTSVTSYPSGYSLGNGLSVTGGATPMVAGAATQATTATENPGAFDIGAIVQCINITFAVKPAGGGGGSSFKAAWLPRNQSSIGSR